jgi:hypothetical protein
MLKTDNNGKLRFRGFCGDYAARIESTDRAIPPVGHRFQIDKECTLNKYTLKTVLQ